MKRISYIFILICCLLPVSLLAQQTVNMPSVDGEEKNVTVTAPITFYDAGGETGNIPTYNITGITFTPKAGERIKIVFETIDLQGGAIMVLFDGAKALDVDEDSNEKTIPWTGRKITLSGSKTNETVVSASSDGKLTVCFQNANGTGAGWKATVTSIPQEQLPANEVRITSTPTVKEVGDTPLNFYDDGGKDGKISEKFEGQITFKPATAGKKVQIDFTKVALFYNSSAVSVGSQDVLNIYNGTEPKPENLLETITDKVKLIKSTSPDGALTVTLKSKTGYPADGFEAIVKQYTPVQMTFDAVELHQYTTGTVSAGDKDQAILSVVIKTKDNKNPLTADRFSFSSNGTFANINKATLYYTGKKTDFATTKKVGEVNVAADVFEITCSTPQALIEGDNYFWLAYDLKDNATNGQAIDAGCSAVTVSGTNKSIGNPQPEGNRIIKNQHISKVGTVTKTIYGEWGYTHTPNSIPGYAGKYEAKKGDQIVTFVPGTSGKIIELDFADFDIYISSSSYGIKAKFQIFNGKTTTGTPLWEATVDNKSTGPGKKIRSTSTDGALTVVFNANTETNGYTGKGWHATVREHQPKPMTVTAINVWQDNKEILIPGAKDQEIIGIEIVTEGENSPLSLDEFVLNLKGSHDKIDRVAIFSTDNKKTFATKTLFGELKNPTQSNVTIAPKAAANLAEGTNYFWVAYDIKNDVAAEQTIDASLTNVKLGGVQQTPANGDPDGERITKYVYLFQNGDNTVNVTYPVMFYDNGGANGNYSEKIKGTVTFVPKAGEVIKFVFKSIATNYRDHFVVLEGDKNGKKIAEYSGYSLKDDKLPKPIVSAAVDGKLTVRFEPEKTGEGWEIEVSSYVPQSLAVSSIRSTAVSSDKLMKGSQNEQMLKVEVTVEGDKGEVNLTSFDFSAEGTTKASDIAAANLYTTDTVSNFSTNSKYAATATSAPFKFEGSTTITKAGIYKFWLTYDIASNAAVGNTVAAKLNTVKQGTSSLNIASNAQASRTVQAGFSGNYTIGKSSAAKYKTFAEAIAALKGGIDGKVVFTVENGTYAETVKIPHVTGASAENTITIKSASGNPADVVVEYNGYSAPTEGDEKLGVFSIHGADYITIEGISVKAGRTSYPATILVSNISQHVTIRNCFVQAPRVATTYASEDIKVIRLSSKNIANSNCDYFTLENSTLDGGGTGLYLDGTGYVSLPKQKGGLIKGNTFRNQSKTAVYMTKEHDGIIENNRIIISGKAASFELKGIDAVMMGNTIIRGNRIYADNTAVSRVYAIFLRRRDDNETLAGRNRLYNNEVILNNIDNAEVHGIYISDAITNTDIVYNSVNISSSTPKENSSIVYGLDKHNKTNEGIVVADNVFQNNAGGYIYNLKNDAYLSGMAFNNNAYYTTSTTKFAKSNKTEIATFDAWKAKSNDQNSIVEQVKFHSDNSLDPTAAGNLQTAKPIDFVTIDINGTARSTTTPTIGAFEFASTTTVPQFTEGYPKITDITDNSAIARIKATAKGKLFYMVKLSTDAAPTEADVVAGKNITIAKNIEHEVTLDRLVKQTEYKVYFVLQSVSGQNSSIISSKAFTTAASPTVVSTFENVTVTSGDFTDGTADFKGFTVSAITDGVGKNNHKAAKLTTSPATVTINNSDKGLVLTGFYLKSTTDVKLTTRKQTETTATATLKSTAGKWRFISLRQYDVITSISLEGSGDIMIDNFSGQPQPIAITLKDTTVKQGDSFVYKATVSGGVEPYTYVWTNALRQTVSTAEAPTLKAENTGILTLTVTDAWGEKTKGKGVITVLGKSKTATFDDLYLDAESYWWGDTVPSNKNTFYSGSYSFNNVLNPDQSSWGAFGYSNLTATTFNMANLTKDQFNSAVGHGANNSANYSVVYPSSYMGNTTLTVTHNADGDSISGFYITNTAWVKHVSLHGTGINSTGQEDKDKPFTTGDWLKLTAKADNGKEIEFYLADYRDGKNTANHYTLDSWQWLDLRSLGKVKNISFTMDGTRKGKYGTLIPTYFCMDDLGGIRNIATADTLRVNPNSSNEVVLDAIFEVINANGADIVYSITDSLSNTLATTSLVANKLKVTGKKHEGKGFIIVSRVVKGQRAFVKIPVVLDNKVSSTTDIHTESIGIYPNPATEVFSINTSGKVDIFTRSGMNVYSNAHYTAHTPINVSNYTPGVYFVRINDKTLKLIVK